MRKPTGEHHNEYPTNNDAYLQTELLRVGNMIWDAQAPSTFDPVPN